MAAKTKWHWYGTIITSPSPYAYYLATNDHEFELTGIAADLFSCGWLLTDDDFCSSILSSPCSSGPLFCNWLSRAGEPQILGWPITCPQRTDRPCRNIKHIHCRAARLTLTFTFQSYLAISTNILDQIMQIIRLVLRSTLLNLFTPLQICMWSHSPFSKTDILRLHNLIARALCRIHNVHSRENTDCFPRYFNLPHLGDVFERRNSWLVWIILNQYWRRRLTSLYCQFCHNFVNCLEVDGVRVLFCVCVF